MSVLNPIQNIGEWILANIRNISISVLTIIVGYIIYKAISRQITRLRVQERLGSHLSYTLNRIVKWVIILLIFSAVLGQFGVTFAIISGFVAIIGGTVLGFASTNTIGNAIAGLIVMISKPFTVGDRICFKTQLADVEGIELIYTKIRTLDNVLISVPNQELLRSEIENFGKKRVIRRHVTITAGFEHDNESVEKCLLEAADRVPDIVRSPEPYVRITDFQNFAVEYTLYVFITKIQKMQEIDGDLRRIVFRTCKQHEIDISTPTLIRSI